MACRPKFTPHPRSAPGDFYVEVGKCLACGVPQAVAPDLVGWVDELKRHCYWIKQPETTEELDQAIKVLDSQELECHRYAGTDPAVLSRVATTCCDYPLEQVGVLQPDTAPTFALLEEPSGLFARARKVFRSRNRV